MASVLVNGSPTAEFLMSKGGRQCDPLSPFLFIIAMEGLNVMMEATIDKGVFDGVNIPNSNIVVSHLFKQDALFIGDLSKKNFSNLSRILRCFHVVSGLKVNFNKSRVFSIRVELVEVNRWASPLGCEPASLPFSYLGVPVGDNMNRKSAWKPIVDKFRSKLSTLKAKTLSFGGRLTLAKVVLGNLPCLQPPLELSRSWEKYKDNFYGVVVQTKQAYTRDKMKAPKDVGGRARFA